MLALLIPPALQAQAPAPAAPKPQLQAGEGFALAELDGPVQVFGEGRQQLPLGGLAQLLWFRMEGVEWNSRMLIFKCTGKAFEPPCGPPKGHGRVDPAKALRLDCRHAFRVWIQLSAAVWKDVYGEGPARVRLEEAFGPFLGKRLPAGNGLPDLKPEWVGEGSLLQASPESFAAWLADPAQEGFLDQARRNLNSFFDDSPWWFHAVEAADGGATRAWAVASDGKRVAVLSLPQGKTRAEALARIKAILGFPGK